MDKRLKLFSVLLTFLTVVVIARLFYWQVIKAEGLKSQGEKQHFETIEIPSKRGEIRSSDGFPLATNQRSFLVYAYLPQLRQSPQEVADLLSPILGPLLEKHEASPSSQSTSRGPAIDAKDVILKLLTRKDVVWTPLVRNASEQQKEEVKKLNLEGIGFNEVPVREYPEASMSASLLGFVGSDTEGNPKGYFGLEGLYDLELKGRPGVIRHEKDAHGRPILVGRFDEIDAKDGRSLVLFLDRSIQRIVEKRLEEGLRKYGARNGEVVILDPRTGAVIAMAALPSYDPAHFGDFDPYLYKNPIVSEAYEPGSTFKVLTMAAALDARAVTPETICETCGGPIQIGGYTIRTWNDVYYPNSTMTEVIVHSDNTGMVFAVRKLGLDTLYEYLVRFGIGEKTGIDLEEESKVELRQKKEWKEIDLATASFGQGIAVTGIQMARIVATIANGGVMLKPQVVHKVEGEVELELKPKPGKRVLSNETARLLTEMMVTAVEKGEAKWAKPDGYRIAGKTGTAQIPVAGHYDEDKTIVSFVGFAPSENPVFAMLVKLREPQSSPWGSETAAPLWFAIAKDLFYYYGIQPE